MDAWLSSEKLCFQYNEWTKQNETKQLFYLFIDRVKYYTILANIGPEVQIVSAVWQELSSRIFWVNFPDFQHFLVNFEHFLTAIISRFSVNGSDAQ